MILSLSLLLYHYGSAATLLSGSIGGMTLTKEAGPYIVEQDLTVPEHESALIGEGCRFFFKPATGIVVEGDLTIAGTGIFPVHFASLRDSLHADVTSSLPAPFDWIGIRITEKAGKVACSHFTITHSACGISSRKPSILIDNGTFLRNGQGQCTIGGTPLNVIDGIPFSYAGALVNGPGVGAVSGGAPMDTGYFPGPAAADAPGSFTGKNATTGKRLFVRTGIPALAAAAGIGSGALSVYYGRKWLDKRDEYRRTSDPARWRHMQDRAKFLSLASIGTGVASAVAVSTGVLLFMKLNGRKARVATIAPVFAPEIAGAAVSVTLQSRAGVKVPYTE